MRHYMDFWYLLEQRRATAARLTITTAAMLMAVVMAVTVFAVSNLSFVSNGEATMSVFYIRTLVDFAGVLILSVQHEQLRENALHSELTAMDNVLRRQYEQYKQSKENIRLINRALPRTENADCGHPCRARSGQTGRGPGRDGERHPQV